MLCPKESNFQQLKYSIVEKRIFKPFNLLSFTTTLQERWQQNKSKVDKE